jgi:hypothetical protein
MDEWMDGWMNGFGQGQRYYNFGKCPRIYQDWLITTKTTPQPV